MPNTKWKDHLLKSSLPFEHLVAEILAKNKWYVGGQYSYPRKNETGLHTEFSVDLHASFEFTTDTHWLATLDLLIECKYSSPGVKWIFSPYPKTSTVFSGCIKVFDQLANKQLLEYRHIESVEKDVVYCIRGISLFDNGFDENSISRGLGQLRYAMPRLTERAFRWHATDRMDADISLPFACAIMVTTAPIYVLKQKLDLEDVFSADSLEDIAFEQEAVILWDEDSPDRERYSEEIYRELIEEGSTVRMRLSEYIGVAPQSTKDRYPYGPSLYRLQKAIRGAGNHVLVINYKYLESYLKKLRTSVRQSTRYIEKFAEVTYDTNNKGTLIKPMSIEPSQG